jgi:hypothetical protein
MKTPELLFLSAFILTGALITPIQGATLSFTTESDYTDNFTETANGSSLSWNNGALAEFNASTTTASIATYNTAVPVTTGSTLSLAMDASFHNLTAGGASIGFITNAISGTGYLSVFRLTSATTADFRVFTDVTTAGTIPSGAIFTSTLTLTGGATFSIDTDYTFSLNVQNTGTQLIFSGSILNASNSSVIGTFTSYSNAPTTYITGTGVAIRLGAINGSYTYADNFSVSTSSIPEPSTYALLSGLAVIGLAAIRRPRR